jgi:hypothetical protein
MGAPRRARVGASDFEEMETLRGTRDGELVELQCGSILDAVARIVLRKPQMARSNDARPDL